jgi:predicted phage-related endonuclease
MSNIDLTAKIKEYKEFKLLAEEAAANAESIADELKTLMTAQGVDEMQVDVFKVRYKDVTSSRFDSAAFKVTHGELYSQYSKQTTSKRFSVA